MGKCWILALFILLSMGVTGGQQQTSPSTQSPTAEEQPTRVKVYAVGAGVTAPELLSLNLPPFSSKNCQKNVDGKVVLSVIVNTAGQPRNIMFIHPLGTELDKFALRIAAVDRFRPGMIDGTPIAVAESLEIDIQACEVESKDSAGKNIYGLQLRSSPTQTLTARPLAPEEVQLALDDHSGKTPHNGDLKIEHVGGDVSAPIPLNHVEAVFTDAAREAKYQGICSISLIVDRNGLPQNAKVLKPLDYGLDQNALAAVNKYRFKPAVKSGEPVSVMITVKVNFRFY